MYSTRFYKKGRARFAFAGYNCHDANGRVIDTLSSRQDCCNKYGLTCPDGARVCYGESCAKHGGGAPMFTGTQLTPDQLINPPGTGKISQPEVGACQFLDFACYARSGASALGPSLGLDVPGCGFFTGAPVIGNLPCWMIAGGALGLILLFLIMKGR